MACDHRAAESLRESAMRCTIFIVSILLMAMLFTACPPDDDDDNDDATPVDDDSGDDDDDDNDDATPDDDDDTTPDDDTGDDDVDDDDTVPDDDATDDDTGDDDTTCLTAAEPSWTFEYIDETYYPDSLGFVREDDGTLHLAYPALRGELIPMYSDNLLRYAVKHPGDDGWEITTIDERGEDVQSICLAMDGDDGLHILYLLDTTGTSGRSVEHAYQPAGGEWTIQTIEEDGVHHDISCGVMDGEVHMVFNSWEDYSIHHLKHAFFGDGQWTIETAFSSGDSSYNYPSLAFTNDDRLLIAYQYDNRLLLAEQTARGWELTDLGLYPRHNSLRVDAAGHVHLAYQKTNYLGGGGDLMYVTDRSGSWETTKIDDGYPASSSTGGTPALVLDAYEGLHIFYANFTEMDIHYQRNLFTGWKFFPVQVAGNSDFTPKALVDDAANLHLVYGEDQGIYYGFCPDCALHPGTPPDDDDTTDDDTADDDLAADDDLIDDAEFAYLTRGEIDLPSQALAMTADGALHWAQAKGNALLLLSQAPGESQWQTRLVDLFAAGSAIAVDGEDRLHLAYRALRGDDIKVAVENGGGWDIATIQVDETPGDQFQLAIDAAGHTHLAYVDLTDETQPVLRYATDAGGAWSTEAVATMYEYHRHFGLALTPDGQPRLAYASPEQRVTFAARTGDGWDATVVDADHASQYVSLGIDGGGTAHIVYLSYTTTYYADNGGGVWSTSPINDDDDTSWPMLAVDADGHVLIAFNCIVYVPSVWLAYLRIFHNLNGDWQVEELGQIGTANEGHFSPLIAADQTLAVGVSMSYVAGLFSNAGGTWAQQTIDEPSVIKGLDLLVDGDGVDHLAFTTDKYDLWHGAFADGDYAEELVSADAQSVPSLAMDGAGVLHAAFLSHDDERLMYANNEAGAWSEEIVYEAPVRFYVQELTLALDGDDRPVIAFQQAASLIGDVLVARWTGGEWSVEAVDTRGDQGDYVSLIVDAQGALHLTYYDSMGDDLRYATDRSGQWATYTVRWRGSVGWGCDLALDENGDVFIAYLDDTFANDVRLLLAMGGEDDWTVVGLDNAAANQSYSGMPIAADADGTLHLLYQPSSDGGMKYASNRGGQWRSGLVDGYPDAGLHQSVALDDDGYAHVAYCVNGALWLARMPYTLSTGK